AKMQEMLKALSPEELNALKAVLAADEDEVKATEEVKETATATDDEPNSVRDAINEAVEKLEAAKEGGELDDAYKAGMKAAADACGLDAESPEFQKAFAEGVKYGEGKEKEEPKHLDRLHESEGMKRFEEKKAMDEEEVKAAMDAAMKKAGADAEARTMKKFRALSAAADAVRPVLGNIDALAFDSADDIYGAALRKMGVNIAKHDKKAWRSMFEVMPRGQQKVELAQDAGLGKTYDGAFAGFNRIRKA
ncbi:MAG: hypothetical protein IJ131_02280, partial [Eggerthellaceae bacterium]|nr:hypothetical protein [Eggerthellaceae bacterium]